jgi:hypothetical protein
MRALFSNTTGVRNSAFGVGALQSNNSGNFNSAFGYTALSSNTAGGSNSAFGIGALASNTLGISNSAFGSEAMLANTTGYRNTAVGGSALVANTTGYDNTAVGFEALQNNTTGIQNTAIGRYALYNNQTGNSNVAVGPGALNNPSSGNGNLAVGYGALQTLFSGNFNIALGNYAGDNLADGTSNIYIGSPYRPSPSDIYPTYSENGTIRLGTPATHTRLFVAGVRGVTTGIPNGISVLIDSDGQLGTVSSSARYKEDIQDMLAKSERIYDLRPVVFRYREAFANGSKPEQFGLIAEQVAEVFPELVVRNEDNLPETVKYHDLAVLLLNELQKERARSRAQEEKLEHLQASLEQLNKTTEQLVKRMEEQELVPVALTVLPQVKMTPEVKKSANSLPHN